MGVPGVTDVRSARYHWSPAQSQRRTLPVADALRLDACLVAVDSPRYQDRFIPRLLGRFAQCCALTGHIDASGRYGGTRGTRSEKTFPGTHHSTTVVDRKRRAIYEDALSGIRHRSKRLHAAVRSRSLPSDRTSSYASPARSAHSAGPWRQRASDGRTVAVTTSHQGRPAPAPGALPPARHRALGCDGRRPRDARCLAHPCVRAGHRRLPAVSGRTPARWRDRPSSGSSARRVPGTPLSSSFPHRPKRPPAPSPRSDRSDRAAGSPATRSSSTSRSSLGSVPSTFSGTASRRLDRPRPPSSPPYSSPFRSRWHGAPSASTACSSGSTASV